MRIAQDSVPAAADARNMGSQHPESGTSFGHSEQGKRRLCARNGLVSCRYESNGIVMDGHGQSMLRDTARLGQPRGSGHGGRSNSF